jgi:hypothetical protein
VSADTGDKSRQQTDPIPRGPARHRRQGATAAYDAEVNMALMRRLAEGAAASGDFHSAAEAVRACMAEAENLYRLAMSEREKALALARKAAEEQARARLLHDEASKAVEDARASRERLDLGSPAKDAVGHRLRPDPGYAQDSAEFIEALRQFRIWAGKPSYRDMARACNGRPVASTMCRVMGRGELPARFEVIEAIISSCGGSEEDRERFATAWRRLTMPGQEVQSEPGLVRPIRGPRRSPMPETDTPDADPA